MIAALYSPEQRATHVEPLAEFVAKESAKVQDGDPATWRIVGVGSDEEARRTAEEWQDRRDRIERAAETLRTKRQAEEEA
jgi:hypothetical protein